jgi:FlaA1/EpsC-like NDP-sugar epimerase
MFLPALVFGIITFFMDGEFEFFNAKVFAFIDDFIFKDRLFFQIVENNIQDEVLTVLLILGTLFIALSKEKYEDEFIMKIRLDALLWATFVNYAILLLSILFIYGTPFFVVLEIQMVSTLILFAFRFKWMLYKSNRRLADEE